MWRELTKDDVAAFLSQRETEAFSRHADFSNDVLQWHIDSVTAKCRNYLSFNGSVKLGVGKTIPECIIPEALAILRYNLLLRFDITPNDARKAANDAALETLQNIVDGKMLVESADGVTENSKAASPAYGQPRPTRILD